MSIEIGTAQVMQEFHRLQRKILSAQMQTVYGEISYAIQNNILLELRFGNSAFDRC